MSTELWRHLVAWELRHTVRGATFWIMVALAALVPVLTGLSSGEVEAMIFAQVMTLSVLVSLWTVFAVKRQVAADVSDDWLLVLTYRQTLVSRYLAGLVVGVLLAVASGVLGLIAVAAWVPEAAGTWLALQPAVLVSLVQPVAMASIIIAAADFLIAAAPVVLFVLLVLDLIWCVMPVAGFAVPLAWLAGEPSPAVVGFLMTAVVVCFGALAFGWWKAEDFWAYLKLAWDKQQGEASLGAVRTALDQAQAPKQVLDRQMLVGARARLSARGVEPLLAHDLARYPWWVLRSSGSRYSWWQVAVLGLICLVSSRYWVGLRDEGESFFFFVFWFGWWILAAATVMRTLSSGAQIVMQEREQRTLESVLVTPLAARRILSIKLQVVLRQALPALLVLTAALALLTTLPMSMAAFVWTATIAAAVGGTLASAMSNGRLQATLLAGVFTAGLVTAMVAVSTHLQDVVMDISVLVARSRVLLGLVDLTIPIAIATLVCALVWFAGRGLGVRAMFRHATAR